MTGVRLRRRLAGASLLLASLAPVAGKAQAAPLDSLLGADEAGLQAALPQAHKLAKPRLGPRGLRGQWAVPGTVLAGLPFEAVFFFRNKQVQRIEQLWSASGTACGGQARFDTLSQALQSRFGSPVLASASDGGELQLSAAWTQQASEVVAHFSKGTTHCALRVVYQAREAKDASEL